MTTSDIQEARGWAERMSEIEDLRPGPRAAIRVIQSLPDHIIDAEKLREVVRKYEGNRYISEIVQDFADLLPAPKLPTLADMGEDARHALVGKDVKVEGWDSPSLLVAVHKDEGAVLGHSWINPWPFVEVRPLSDLTPVAAPEQEAESTSESVQPRPEDVPPAEKVTLSGMWVDDGSSPVDAIKFLIDKYEEHALPCPDAVPPNEPWLIEIDGEKYVGTRYEYDGDIPWSVAALNGSCAGDYGDSQVTLIHKLVPETP